MGSRLLPEMLFGAELSLTHEASGVALVFNATEALKEWRAEALPPVQVACAAAWASAHERRLKEGVIRGWGAAAVATEAQTEDWTFTTPFGGSVVERGGAQASGGHASGWRPVEERIDRAALLRRDPILFYDDLTLYESELDDNGSMVLSVKLRVGPQYWYVLLRYWLRVDGVLLRCVSQLLPQPRALTRRPRLRETRIFCNTADAAAQAGGATLLREPAVREETFEGLRERGERRRAGRRARGAAHP